MMKCEFEKIAGYEVSDYDYKNILEPMYLATNLSKQEFVQTINKQRFALQTKRRLMIQIKKIAKHLYEMCGISENCNELAQLQKLCYEYAQRFSGINIQMDSMAWVDFANEHKNGCT